MYIARGCLHKAMKVAGELLLVLSLAGVTLEQSAFHMTLHEECRTRQPWRTHPHMHAAYGFLGVVCCAQRGYVD